MNTGMRGQSRPQIDDQGTPGWVSVAMLAVGVPLGTWGVIAALLGGGGSQSVAFNVMAGWFLLLALGYLSLHGLRNLAWCSVPALLTFRALLGFIAVPSWRFISGDDQVDSVYVHAMLLALIGMATFWIGSLVLMKRTRLRFVPRLEDTSSRVKLISTGMLLLGLVVKIVMWKAGLLSYTANTGARESVIAYMELFVFLGNMLPGALLISAIEVFGRRSPGAFIRSVFWLAVVFSLGFGAISGMKQQLVQPLLTLALVYAITKRRIPRGALIFLPLLIVVIYPFENAYRANLNNGYREQAHTVEGLTGVLVKSFDDVVLAHASSGEKAGKGFDDTTNRLSVLAYIHDIIGLPDPSLLNGTEKVWLAPIYPLVPRALWRDKPVLNKGQRLSEALGRPDTTSSAPTTIGDLYMLYGTYGVAIGMFIYGIGAQLYMNWVCRGDLSEKRLFIYLMLLVPLINFEVDAVALVAGAVQSMVIVAVTSYVIYGRAVSASPYRFAGYRRPVAAS